MWNCSSKNNSKFYIIKILFRYLIKCTQLIKNKLKNIKNKVKANHIGNGSIKILYYRDVYKVYKQKIKSYIQSPFCCWNNPNWDYDFPLENMFCVGNFFSQKQICILPKAWRKHKENVTSYIIKISTFHIYIIIYSVKSIIW